MTANTKLTLKPSVTGSGAIIFHFSPSRQNFARAYPKGIMRVSLLSHYSSLYQRLLSTCNSLPAMKRGSSPTYLLSRRPSPPMHLNGVKP